MACNREKRCGDDLEAYRVAIQLPAKWLNSKKTARDLVELFFRHYCTSQPQKKKPNPAEYCVAVEGPSGIVEIENSALLSEVVATSRKLWVVIPEPLIVELSAEDKVRALCAILEEMPFRLLSGLLYRVIAGRTEALDRIKEDERLFYNAFRDVVVSSSMQALEIGVQAVIKDTTGSVTRAVCQEILKAKKFLIAVPEPKRRQLEKFEGFDILPRRTELCQDIFNLSIPLRTKWKRSSTNTLDFKNHQKQALAYFIRSYYSPRGDVLLYETVTALASYLRQRIRVRPIAFGPTIVQINARDGRFAAFLKRACGAEDKELEVIPTDFREKIATSSVNIIPRGEISDILHFFKRPTILINVWSYLDDDSWLSKCKQICPDQEFEPLDIPEIVLLGPTSDLAPRFTSSNKDKDRHYTPAPHGARPLQPRIDWKPFEGYDVVHLEEVSRQMLHVDDLSEDSYGHSCCVSLRSRGSTLTEFRNEDDIKVLEAQCVLAGAVADAQRNQFNPNDHRRARELQLAQEFLQERQKKLMQEYQANSESDLNNSVPVPPLPSTAASHHSHSQQQESSTVDRVD